MSASVKKVVDNTLPWNTGEMWNHADIHGKASKDFDALMGSSAPLIEKHWSNRYMPTRGWRAKTKTWAEWLDDSLTWHREDDRKDGAGYVFGASANGERSAGNMRGMVAIFLDVEPEQPLEDVIDRCEASSLAIVLHTSHNFGRTTDSAPVDSILKHGGEVSTEAIRAYLRSKIAYSEDFISQCELTAPRADIGGEIQAVWSCPPLQKMRVGALFAEPVDVTTLDPSPKRGQEIWANKVRGLAQILGLRIDPVATDPSRILYIAKHRPGTAWYCAVFRGRPVQWDEIPEVAKGADNPFLQAAGGKGGSTIPDITTNIGIDVTALYRRFGKRWLLADMLSNSDVAKGEDSDRLHVECPFSDAHTSESGPTSTTVWNAGETEHGFAMVLCQHTCKERYHTVDYVARWIEDGVIDPDWLEDSNYMIGAPDQTGPFEELTPAELTEQKVTDEGHRDDLLGKLIASAEVFEKDTVTDQNIRDLLTQAIALYDVIGETGKAALLDAIASKTRLGVRELKPIWREIAENAAVTIAAEEARQRAEMKTPDYRPASDATPESIRAAAAASKWLPSSFVHRKGWFCQMRDDKACPVSREFEVLYSADGKKGSTRTNEVTIRYQHRSAAWGIVESTFRIGDTYKDSGSILGRLRNEGLDFAPGAPTDAILTLLRAVDSDREAVYVERSGWVSETVWVSPTGEVVKRREDECLYVLDHTMRVSADKAGTLDMAIRAASTALKGRNAKRFLPGFLGGAVGMLAEFLNEELAVIIANEGKAKQGKTTALKAGISWITVAAADGLLITGNVTPTAMEAMAVKASGGMFAPDEQGTSKATAEDEQTMVLQYAGRIGRARGKTDGSMRDVQTWHGCMGMSTENGLLNRLEAEQARDGTVDIRSGALSRIFTVNYDAAVKLNATDDAGELEAYQVLAHGGAYGWLGPTFAAKLIELGVETVKTRVSALVSEWGKRRSGAAERVVRTAALFGVVAEIGQEAGLLPEDVDLKAMLANLLTETLEQRAHHLDTEQQAKETLRRQIIRMVNRRQIVEVGNAEEARGEIVGYWKSNSHSSDLAARTYILPIDRFGMLVKTELGALVEQLRAKNAVVLPSEKTKHYKAGLWENTPGEGKKVKCLRVSGEWVHGDDLDEEAA